MAFPFLGLFIIFLSVAAYYRKRATAQQKKVTEDFWNREDQANQIRRKDISNLPYITIPLEKFPIGISDDEELTDYENDLKTLASRKILNLSHQSNTDLSLPMALRIFLLCQNMTRIIPPFYGILSPTQTV